MDFNVVIEDRVYQGSAPHTPQDWAQLQSLRIDAVVDLQLEPEDGPGIALPPDAAYKMMLVWAPIPDAAPAPDDEWLLCLARLLQALWVSGRKCYLHCRMGISRATLADVLLHMVVFGISADEAIARIRAARPVAAPNRAFVAALRRIHRRIAKELHGGVAQ